MMSKRRRRIRIVLALAFLPAVGATFGLAQDALEERRRKTLRYVWEDAETSLLNGDTEDALLRYDEYLLLCAQAEGFGKGPFPMADGIRRPEEAARRAMALRRRWRARLRYQKPTLETVKLQERARIRGAQPMAVELGPSAGIKVVAPKGKNALRPVPKVSLAEVAVPVEGLPGVKAGPDAPTSDDTIRRAVIKLADAAAMSAEGRTQAALAVYEKTMPSLRVRPELWVVALQERVACLAKLDRRDEARELCRDAIRELPAIADAARLLLADLDTKTGKE